MQSQRSRCTHHKGDVLVELEVDGSGTSTIDTGCPSSITCSTRSPGTADWTSHRCRTRGDLSRRHHRRDTSLAFGRALRGRWGQGRGNPLRQRDDSRWTRALTLCVVDLSAGRTSCMRSPNWWSSSEPTKPH